MTSIISPGFNTTYLIIIVVAVVVVCVLIVLCALHFKKKLPAFGGAGKNFKPVDQAPGNLSPPTSPLPISPS